METQHHRAWVLCMEAVPHDVGPHATRGSELGDFLKQIVMTIKEKRELPRETIHVQPCKKGRLHVRDRIREREGDLLHSGRASLANMVAADANCIPTWQILGTIAEDISDDTHRVLRWVD